MKTTSHFNDLKLIKLIAIIIASCIPMLTLAQNYSGLQNKELMPDVSKETVVGGLLEVLTTGDLSGKIVGVKVLDDQDVSVTVAVSFIGFTEGYVHFTLADEQLKAYKGFPVQKVSISSDKKEVQTRLQLDPKSFVENETFTVPRLILNVSKSETGTNGIQRVYKLNKKFTNPISPDNIIIPISLNPVGSAASLPKTPPVENPGGRFRTRHTQEKCI